MCWMPCTTARLREQLNTTTTFGALATCTTVGYSQHSASTTAALTMRAMRFVALHSIRARFTDSQTNHMNGWMDAWMRAAPRGNHMHGTNSVNGVVVLWRGNSPTHIHSIKHESCTIVEQFGRVSLFETFDLNLHKTKLRSHGFLSFFCVYSPFFTIN